MGIGNAINHGPVDPFNLQGQLNDAVSLRDKAQNDYWNANNQLTELRNALSVLQVRLNVQQQVQAALPLVKGRIDHTVANCVLLQKKFTPLKAAVTDMVLKMGKVQGDATVTKAIAYTKREFASGVLQMALDALVDVSLVDVSKRVDSDVITNYGSAIPDDVKTVDDQIAQQIVKLKDMPSITL